MEDEEVYKYENASIMAGEYIVSVGRPVEEMSRPEWLELLHVIVKGYHEAPPPQASADQRTVGLPPF